MRIHPEDNCYACTEHRKGKRLGANDAIKVRVRRTVKQQFRDKQLLFDEWENTLKQYRLSTILKSVRLVY